MVTGEGGKEGGWYEIRGEKSNVVVGPDGMSKIELSFAGRIAQPGLQPSLGWLTLRGSGDNWKRYFFMLDPYNQMIRYFANPEAVSDAAPKALGEFNIRCCQVDDVDYDAPYPNTFKVKTFFGRMLMYSDSPEERDRWVDTLREVGNPIGIRSLPAPPLANNRNSLSMSPPASSDAIAVRKQPVQPEQPPSQHEPPAQPELPAQREPAPVQQPVPVQVVQQVQRITPPATREIPPLQQPAASTTAPLTKSAQSPPQSGDSHMQLQRKFEATRRALADHVAKCRNLEVSGRRPLRKYVCNKHPRHKRPNICGFDASALTFVCVESYLSPAVLACKCACAS